MSFTFPQWSTALDLDFTTQVTQSLSADTTYTIGANSYTGSGLVWNKLNSANQTSMTVTNGTGLIINPTSTTAITGSTFSAPTIRIQLNNIVPDWTVFMPLRIWIWESNSNELANNDQMVFGTSIFDTLINPSFQNQLTFSHWRGYAGATNGWGSRLTVLQSDVTTTATSVPLSTNRVGVIYLPMGVLGGVSPLLVGSGVTLTSTTIAALSNGVSLPTGTINVASTAGFATSGTINVSTNAGSQLVTYTGTTGTSFTGCTGGTGTMSTGGFVTFGTWPSLNSLIFCTAASVTAASSAAISSGSSGARTVPDTSLFISALRNGSGTGFSATIARLRVDFLPINN